jgi:flagellar hook-associated protein 1 FlgK
MTGPNFITIPTTPPINGAAIFILSKFLIRGVVFGKIVSNTGTEIQANQETLETFEAAYQVALDNKNEFSGVDLDTEAARLMEQQQAYQALARVLTTARELLDTLLRSM